MVRGERINEALKKHQAGKVPNWPDKAAVTSAHRSFDIFNRKLFSGRLPQAAITFEPVRCTTLGKYTAGRNGLGVRHTITLNARLFRKLTRLERLLVLVHQMIHMAEEVDGRSTKTIGYHDEAFCAMARTLGIIVEPPEGHVAQVCEPFLGACRAQGVKEMRLREASPVKGHRQEKGRSKLVKYCCRCSPPVNLRTGIKTLDATCNRCGSRFEMVPMELSINQNGPPDLSINTNTESGEEPRAGCEDPKWPNVSLTPQAG